MDKLVKVARICNNDHNWKFPSRKEIKSANEKTYENVSGFGHEEWLLDRERLFKGYHYAFLQPVNNAPDKHEGNKYQIHLFFITAGALKHKGYVGYIDNVECLTMEQAKECLAFYQEQGWIEQMKEQIKEIQGNTKVFDKEIKTNARSIFNVRFKLEDVHVETSNFKKISKDDKNTKSSRYVLMDYKGDFLFEKESHSHVKGKNNISTDSYYRTVESGTTEVSARHRLIQDGIKRFLKKTKKYLEIRFEVDYKDIYAIRKDGINEVYEIKTYNAKRCIREAIGQLLEYNHYPSRPSSDILYVVGEEPLDKEDKQYMSFLRERYNLPIWYRQYNVVDNRLSEKE